MTRPGAVAEWLGRGLQSLVQRFESARRLETFHLQVVLVIFGWCGFSGGTRPAPPSEKQSESARSGDRPRSRGSTSAREAP